MKKLYKSIVIVILCIVFTTCTNDDKYERGYPKVTTINITKSSETGSNFNAEILNYENINILEYGFLWSEKLGISVNESEKKVVGTNFLNGKFSSRIESALKNNTEYFVRAYVKTADFTVYGNLISFEGKGSIAATIKNITPNAGVWGDTIQIKGNNFSYKTTSNKVLFNAVEAKVIKSNDTIITCVVPAVENARELSIKVEVADHTAVSPINFSVKAPEIISVSKLIGTYGDELIIKGNYFGKQAGYNKFYFGNTLAILEYISKNTLKVFVPNAIENKITELKIVSNSMEATFDTNFELISPKITSIHKTSIFTGEEIEIKGDYFHPEMDKNVIKFNDIKGEVISFDNQILKVKIPIGPFIKRDLNLKIEVLDMQNEFANTINILNQWVLVSDDLPFTYYGHNNNYLPAGNSVFLIARGKHFSDFENYLWKLNPSDFTWTKHNLPDNITVSSFTSNGEKVYIYDINNNFWEYNETNNSWIQKKSYPGKQRGGASHFSINGEIYLGMGTNQVQYTVTNLRDFYKYNPTTDTWTQIADFHSDGNHRKYGSATFVINDVAYLGNGASDTGMFDFWSYNSTTDSWIKIADFVDARHSTAAFSLHNYGYVTGGNSVGGSNVNYAWRYDPNLNVWEQIEEVGTVKRGRHFAFILDGKAYIGGGGVTDSGGMAGYDMYQFKPN